MSFLMRGAFSTATKWPAAISATLDFWLTLGKEGEAFEEGLAKFLGVKKSVLCNSGSSANLLAVSALSSPKLGNRRLKPGDEIITVAAGFPTTVAPILQNGFVPVFIDADPATLERQSRAIGGGVFAGQNQGGHFRAHAGQSVSICPPSWTFAKSTSCG